MSTRHTQKTVGVLAVAVVMAGHSVAMAASEYDFGYVWDVWSITNTPASPTPANTGFKIQVRNRYGTWRTVDSGTTDAAGNAWGMVCSSFGPTTEGKYLVGHDDAVRIKWNNGTRQNMPVKDLPAYAVSSTANFNAGTPAIAFGNSITIPQNAQQALDALGQSTWLQDGSLVRVTLPVHFTFANLPFVDPIFPGGLQFGPPFIENDGRTLAFPVLINQRLDPLNGFRIENIDIAYDGIAVPAEYPYAIDQEIAVTPLGDPLNTIDAGAIYGFLRGGRVWGDVYTSFFDETNGGAGFPDFQSLAAAHQAWVAEVDEVIDFEDLDEGEVAVDQAADRGFFFRNTDGGVLGELSGVGLEDDPNLVETLTGYDGTYQPDGSRVYVRFDNTESNPEGVFTIEFAALQSTVGAFLAQGVQGEEHSFTVTAHDHSGAPIAQKTIEAQLWEPDATGQNYETLFAVRASIPVIRSVSIRNNSAEQFADVLIIDTISRHSTSSSLGMSDSDNDGDVDLIDFSNYVSCDSGPGGGVTSDCVRFDTESDGDVDFADKAAFPRNASPQGL